MNKLFLSFLSIILFLGTFLTLNSCTDTAKTTKEPPKKEMDKTVYPSDVLPIFNEFNLVLGDGSNAGIPNKLENKTFFYTENDGNRDWVVYKAPNAGSTHGTSNNTRTELAQTRKWSPLTPAKLTATLKVMNVSKTGDARVAASYSVVVNTKGEDNSGRWDFSTPVWGYDFSVIGTGESTAPPESADGIALGEEFSYEIEVKDGTMHIKFMSDGHETKTFSKNLIVSEYPTKADIPEQTQNTFVQIGQDGVERQNAYADEFLFFKQGSYNQTNGKSPEVNKLWCSGAETHGGDIEKQYKDGNYAEIWFKSATISVSDASVSNKSYFTRND